MTTDTTFPGSFATAGRERTATTTAALLSVVVALSVASVLIGARNVPLSALVDPDHPLRGLYEARVPRTLFALAVGAALGLAGACMQGLTRNPLADPGLLGIHAGATVAMVVAMSAFTFQGHLPQLGFAFLGSAIAAIVVHGLAAAGRDGATPVRLVIAGAAVTAALTSVTSALLVMDASTFDGFRFWLVGSVAGKDLDVLATALPFLALGTALALAGAPMLDSLALGDDVARALGRRPVLDRVVVGLSIVLLCGTATSLAGPIAFVGLMVPHAIRVLNGPGHRALLPLSAIAGAALMVAADTLGRVILPPTEVQAGIMCAVVGVPFFALLLRRGRLGAL